ncbi:potassium transporter TrkA [Sphingobacteriales bacterium UPWRP_1]|nr:potassium transporter TrkA [Sphingobacteriales bacterium TSM_CSM]PSJ75545.1 potassium transporter TrkA [Sphingobacteriales bacterium UPWRP_1]
MEIAIVLSLLVLAVVMFSLEKISPDIVTLMLLITLIISGILTPKEAFEGFSNDFIIMLASIFIISASLQNNGVMDWMSSRLNSINKISETGIMLLIMTMSGAISAFMNNTTVSAMLIPTVISIARRIQVSPSRLLMPMAFATLFGGTCTLIGTSTNVAGSAYMSKMGLQPIGMFELLPLGLTIWGAGSVAMLLLGRRFLPDTRNGSVTERYNIRQYLSEIIVLPGSKLLGKPVFNLDLGDIKVLKLLRNKETIFPDGQTRTQPGDMLLVEGDREELIQMRKNKGIEIRGSAISDTDLESDDVKLAELLVMAHSELVNSTLKEVDFRRKYHLSVLAIHRKNYNFNEKIGHVQIKTGDVLLVQGKKDDIAMVRKNSDLMVINELEDAKTANLNKGAFTVLLFAVAIILGSFNLLPLSVAFLAAAVLVVLTRAIDLEGAYSSIDWRLLVLIGGMTAFGTAMDKTGADVFLAQQVIKYMEPFGVYCILAGFMALTVLLTQPMSNAAAAMVVLPMAIQTASTLGVNERTFAIAVIVSASISMITPFEPACILIYGPGQYRIRDFLRVGGILTIISLLLMLYFIPILWPM